MRVLRCGGGIIVHFVDSKSTNLERLANQKLIAILPEPIRMQSGS